MILVTGGCGYIGSQLIRDLHLTFKGETIRILDNMFRERYVSLWDLPSKVYEVVEGDLRSVGDVKRAVEGCRMVFDLAGITNAPLSFEREDLTKQVNFEGSCNILKECMKAGVEKLVYASTASVYGPTSGVVDEDYDCKPVSPYGKYKLLMEKEISKEVEAGFDATILRLATVYGWSVGMRFDTVVDRFVYLACIGMPLTVYDSALNEKRPYVHVKDASRAFIFSASAKSGIFNIVGQNAGIGEIVETIRGFIPDVKIVITKTPSLNQLSYVLDNSKSKKAGYETCYTLKNGVEEIISKFSAIKRR